MITIDLTPKLPSLTFIGLKSRPQANGGNKNRSGYLQEHLAALVDNQEFDALPKSIGGIPETGGLPEGTNV